MQDLPQGWFHDGDIKTYRSLVEQVPDNGKIIELGVWKGRSLCSIADIIKRKNLIVYAVDTFEGSKDDITEKDAKKENIRREFDKNMKVFGLTPTVYAMTTNEAAKKIKEKFDLVFLDADHSYDAVNQDIDNWLPKCKGIIAGHDYELLDVSRNVDRMFPNVKYIHCATDPGRGTLWWEFISKDMAVAKKKIDVIIPAYKAQGTIERTLASIAMQSIIDKVTVTIVNDADGIGYDRFVNQFNDFMDIREIRLKKNVGPGVARQEGIDNTTSPYFTCIDADDTFAGAFALEILLRGAETNPEYHTVVGAFAEQQPNLTFVNHTSDLVWMFGKLYTRAFCEKYKIRFNETRANEDNGFNTIIRLVSSETEKIMFLPDIVYYWHWKEDSITRINNAQYSYDQSFVGYADNMIYAIKHARSVKPQNKYIDMWAIQTMAQLYIYYYQTVKRDPRFTKQNYSYCVKYYNEVFKEMYERMTKEDFNDIFGETMAGQAQNMKDIVPEKTLYQFIESLCENNSTEQ